MSEFEYDFTSLVLATVGLFFICCAIVQKKPRHILEEAFGLSTGKLRDFKSSIFKRNQVVMGYVCVVLAIVFNLFKSSQRHQVGVLDGLSFTAKVAVLVATLAGMCGILNYLCRLWSKSAFRRHLVDIITEQQFPFEENIPLTKDIGKLLGVPQNEHDTVEAYIARVRTQLDIPQPAVTPRRVSRFG
jgi:hypothetical protein